MKAILAIIIAIVSLVIPCVVLFFVIKGLIIICSALFDPIVCDAREKREARKAARQILKEERKKKNRITTIVIVCLMVIALVVYIISTGSDGFKALVYTDGELREIVIDVEKPGVLEIFRAAMRAVETTVQTFLRVLRTGG